MRKKERKDYDWWEQINRGALKLILYYILFVVAFYALIVFIALM